MILHLLIQKGAAHDAAIEYLDFLAESAAAPGTIRHHILPRSIWPDYADLSIHTWNVAQLTHTHHVLAHYYLHKALGLPQTAYALHRMQNGTKIERTATGAVWSGVEFKLHHSEHTKQLLSQKAYASAEQRRQTCLERYGVYHYAQTDVAQLKFEHTMERSYGVRRPLQFAKFREKAENTCVERFGSKNVMQSQQGKDLHVESVLQKYNVRNVMQVDEILQKCIKSRRHNNPDTSSWTASAREKAKEVNSRTCLVVDKSCNIFRASPTDARVLSGEWVKHASWICVSDISTRRGFTKGAWTKFMRKAQQVPATLHPAE